ncbi:MULTISPECIES: zinc-dependent metalloprotease [unclassified Corallococcus]|uniref:zinc-dependent metalloprotease n=1 Tax=unclassified Corallococcus TaxID=2685029 RepID=UPI001A8F4E51|nr:MULTISPECIES: zinc-dependent metalloprotease [unclassified Corallococcus]MBN9686222.1 zinc-dependent metalloprotease [Corallococcus sp. NCSPR001]WAS82346.1 zinc-dependent metalloprotease [Corallococcus sp. NCRR]
MFKRAAVLAVGCGAWLSGCGADLGEAHPEIISNLMEAGFQARDIQVVGDAVYVGGDAEVSVEASREMLQAPGDSEEQYRTTNVVNKSLVRKICINPTSAFNSYSRLSQGLDLAIQNYNALGLCFTMVRGPSTGCNATITAATAAGTSYNSGYPSGGLPYGTITIGTGWNTAPLDTVEHIVTHELGHALGMRHSDYYSQVISCGTGGSEGTAGVGAILIPGTPATSYVNGSIFNACLPPNPTGEFTSTDITALTYLYRC